MANANFKQAAKRLRETLARKYETAQTTQTAGAVGTGKLYIQGQFYSGSEIDGPTTVVNTGRLAAAAYAPATGGGSTVVRSGSSTVGSGSTTPGDYLPLDGSLAMTGDLNMGGYAIGNVATVDGRDVAADGAVLDAIQAAQILVMTLDGTLTNERALVVSDALTLGDGGAGAQATLGMATPATLTATSTNDATTNHSHAVAASNNPGAQVSLLKSDTDGSLTLTILTASTKVRTALLDTESVDMTIQPGGDLILDPAGNAVVVTATTRLGTDNYASHTTGWAVDYNGAADFRYIFTDEMHAVAFIADLEQALAGLQMIAKSVTLLYSAFTAPAAGATSPLTVKDLPSAPGMAVFEDGDIVAVREFNRSGGSLSITYGWGEVALDTTYGTSGFDSATGSQRYTFTRSSAPNAGAMTTGTVIAADAIVLDFGTEGNGYYEVNAIDGLNAVNSPYAQVVTWTGHPHSGKQVKARFGNLAGITDTVVNPTGYGLYSDNAFLKGTISAAGNQVLINGDGIRVQAVTTEALDDINAYRFETASEVVMGGLYARHFSNAYDVFLQVAGDASNDGWLRLEALGHASNGDANLFLYATNDPEGPDKEASIWLDVDDSAALVRLFADDYIRFESPTQSFENMEPYLDLGADLGTASKRWGILYVDQVVVSTGISGDTLSGKEWEYPGDMTIDANNSVDTTLNILNSGAGGVTVNVQGNLQQSGVAVSLSGHTHSQYLSKSGDTLTGNLSVADTVTIDGVDLSAHAADANAHHNRQHGITSSSDHTVTGAALDVVGLSATDTLGILTPSAAPGAVSALLKSDSGGGLTLVTLTATTDIKTPQVDTVSGNLELATGGVARATVSATGLGIGVAAASLLHVHDSSNAHARFTVSATGNTSGDGLIVGYTSNAYVWNHENTALTLATNNTVRVTVTAGGNVSLASGAVTTDNYVADTTGWQISYAGAADVRSVRTPSLTAAAALTIAPTGNLILSAPAVQIASAATLGSDNFATTTTGWQVTYAGAAEFRSVTGDTVAGATVTASTSVTTPVVTAASTLTLSPTGSLVLDPANGAVQVDAGASVRSTDYVSQATGWAIDTGGLADFRRMFVDEMHARSFIADLEVALAGGQIVSKSVAVLNNAFTVPAPGSSALLSVKDLPSAPDMATFEDGDIVGVRQFSRAGGALSIGWAWGTVSGYADGSGVQNWTFTRLGSATYGTITQRGTAQSSSNSSASSRSVTKPTGVVSGDTLFALVTHDGSADTITASGWTLIQYVSGTDIHAGLFYKVAGGSEPASYTFSTNNSHALAATVTAYTGADTTTYTGGFSDYSIQANSASANLTAPSVYVGSTNDIVLFFGGVSNNTSVTPPGGFAEEIDAGSSGIRVYLATDTGLFSGESGSKTATIGSSSHASIGAMIVLSAPVTGVSADAGTLAAGSVIAAEALALDFGASGDGYYEVTALDGNNAYGSNAPYMQIVTWADYPGNATVRVRVGNLGGISGASAGEYGFYAGDGAISATNTYVRLSTAGVSMNNVDLTVSEAGVKKFEVIPATGMSLLADNSQTNQRQIVAWYRDLSSKSADPAAELLCYTDGNTNNLNLLANRVSGFNGASVTVGAPTAYIQLVENTSGVGAGTLAAGSWSMFGDLNMNGNDLVNVQIDAETITFNNAGQFLVTLGLSDWYLGVHSGANPLIGFDANDYILYNRSTDVLGFSVGNVFRLNLTSAGYLSLYSGGPSSPGFHVIPASGTSQQAAIIIGDTDAGNSFAPYLYLGRNSNASTPSAGWMRFTRKDNNYGDVWVDTNGMLRIAANSGVTSTTDFGGTIVGTQTSSLDSKEVLGNACAPDEAIGHVIRAARTALRRFRYKSGAIQGQEFEGIVTDYYPRYGMDRDEEHPAGKALNEIQILSDLLQSVEYLYRKVQALELDRNGAPVVD